MAERTSTISAANSDPALPDEKAIQVANSAAAPVQVNWNNDTHNSP
jgi:hypothetical protein